MKQPGGIPRAIFPLLSFLIAIAPQTFGQNKPEDARPQAPAIKVRTGLVLIPAVVTDAKGNRVLDMKKEDFVVLEDGKRQEIQLFERMETKAEVAKPTATPEGVFTNTTEGRNIRLSIFVLDLLNSSFNEQRTAREELLDSLSKALDAQEPLCLLAIDSSGVKLIHDFTTEPSVLIEALKKVKGRAADKDKPAANPEELGYAMGQGTNSKSGTRNAAMEEARLQQLSLFSAIDSLQAKERVGLTLEALREIGEAFAGIPGRKSMIWATGGFPFEIDDAATFGLRNRDLLPAYEQAWRALNQANIAVYPLDVSDLVNPAHVGAGIGRPRPQHVHLDMHIANMENFAATTGGKFCDRSWDARKCFDQAAKDSSDYYLLGFYDQGGRGKPGWRKLSVRSMRTGLQVRARTGYYMGGAAPAKPDEKVEIEEALVAPFDYPALPMTVKITGTAGGNTKETKTVAFVYAVPGAGINVEAENGNQLRLEFAALARDGAGKIVGSFSKVIGGKLSEAQATQVREKGILFTGTMELARGEYSLSFVVKDEVNDALGSVAAPFKVE
jgi:VWFA-related protein